MKKEYKVAILFEDLSKASVLKSIFTLTASRNPKYIKEDNIHDFGYLDLDICLIDVSSLSSIKLFLKILKYHIVVNAVFMLPPGADASLLKTRLEVISSDERYNNLLEIFKTKINSIPIVSYPYSWNKLVTVLDNIVLSLDETNTSMIKNIGDNEDFIRLDDDTNDTVNNKLPIKRLNASTLDSVMQDDFSHLKNSNPNQPVIPNNNNLNAHSNLNIPANISVSKSKSHSNSNSKSHLGGEKSNQIDKSNSLVTNGLNFLSDKLNKLPFVNSDSSQSTNIQNTGNIIPNPNLPLNNIKLDIKALVVDDSAVARDFVLRRLKSDDINVDLATDGQEAMILLNQKRYDVVFLDILMPGVDGYEVCKQIKSDSLIGSTMVVIMSSKTGMIDKLKGTMAGCDMYLSKPVGEKDLFAVVNKLKSNKIS